MALQPYVPQTWLYGSAGGTPLNPPRLGTVELGLKRVTDEVIDMGPKLLNRQQALVPTAEKTADYTGTSGDFVPVNASGGNRTVTLPVAVPGARIAVKKVDNSVNSVTIALASGDTLDGLLTGCVLRVRNDVRFLTGTSSGWMTESGSLPMAFFDIRTFGAKVDGNTNDTAAVQAAVNAAAVNGGVVFFPAGVCRASGVILKTKVWLRGCGHDASEIKGLDGSSLDVIVGDQFSALTGTTDRGGIWGFGICDLSINANQAAAAAGSTGCGVRFYGFGYSMENVRIRQAKGWGLWSEWGYKGSPTTGSQMEASLVNVKVHDNSTGGVRFYGPNDSYWIGGDVYKNFGVGIDVGGNSPGMLFQQVHVWGNETPIAWKISSPLVNLSQCVGEGATVSQVDILAHDTTIMGGQYFCANGGQGIRVGPVAGGGGPGGVHVRTKLNNFLTGALVFNADGGNSVYDIICWAQSGAQIIGTPDSRTQINCLVNGGATGGRLKIYSTSQAMLEAPSQIWMTSGTAPSTPANGVVAFAEGGTLKSKDSLGNTAILQDQNTAMQGNVSTVKQETIPAHFCVSSTTLVSGDVAFAYFTALASQAITSLATVSSAASQVGATLIRFGLYTVDGSGNLTLVARTVNGSGTAWASTTAVSTLALDSSFNGGGTYTLVRGQRYAFAVLGVGMTTVAKLLGNFQNSAGATNFAKARTGHIGSQADLATSYTAGAVSTGFASFFWGGMA